MRLTRFVTPLAALLTAGVAGAQPATDATSGWNIVYEVPRGWQVTRTVGRLQVLSAGSADAAIFAAPGAYASHADGVQELSQFYSALGLTAAPAGAPEQTTIAGMRAIVATYRARDQMGRTLVGRYVGLLSPHGTGMNMLALATPERFDALRETVERMAATVRAAPPATRWGGRWWDATWGCCLHTGRA